MQGSFCKASIEAASKEPNCPIMASSVYSLIQRDASIVQGSPCHAYSLPDTNRSYLGFSRRLTEGGSAGC